MACPGRAQRRGCPSTAPSQRSPPDIASGHNRRECHAERAERSMSVMAPDVSVVIVNWNAEKYLRDCLRSIVDETRSEYEIIVVDNASSDNSLEMLLQEF